MMEKPAIRILFIHHGSAHGGAPLSLLYLLQQLASEGFECIVCSSRGDPDVARLFEAQGFQTCSCLLKNFSHTTGGDFNLLSWAGWREFLGWVRDYPAACTRLDALISDIKPDFIHFNSLTLAPYARAVRRREMPCCVHVRDSILSGFLGVRKRFLSHCLDGFADHVIAVCKDNLSQLALRSSKGSVIYNSVEFGKFDYRMDQAAVRQKLGIPVDAKVVLFAGGSVPEIKGLREFLKAMACVKRLEPRLVCLMPSFSPPLDPRSRVWTWKRRIAKVLGIYRKTDQLHQLLLAENLQSSLVTSAFVYNIEEWIAAADVVCALHIEPHFSRTVIEAGAMKRPVVAYRIGGIEEVVEDGRTGILLPIGEIEGTTEAVLRLFRDENLSRELGENGYRQAKALFDAQKCAEQVGQVYESLLKNRIS